MIKLKEIFTTEYTIKQNDAIKLYDLMKSNNFTDMTIDLEGIDIVATAFFNKLFFLLTNDSNFTTDAILEKIKIFNASTIHEYAFQSAVDISYNNENKK